MDRINVSLLTELIDLFATRFYKHLAPDGATILVGGII